MKLAQQLRGVILPIKKSASRVKSQVITEELKKFEPYKYLRNARGQQRNKGKREKIAREAAEKA